jgi:hypothetical protein
VKITLSGLRHAAIASLNLSLYCCASLFAQSFIEFVLIFQLILNTFIYVRSPLFSYEMPGFPIFPEELPEEESH